MERFSAWIHAPSYWTWMSFWLCTGFSLFLLYQLFQRTLQATRYRQNQWKSQWRNLFSFQSPEWTLSSHELLWLQRIKCYVSSGHSLPSALQLAPPEGCALQANQPLGNQLRMRLKEGVLSGWKRLSLTLLFQGYESGHALAPLLEPLLTLQTTWQQTRRETDLALKPIKTQLLFCLLAPLLVPACLFALDARIVLEPTSALLAVLLYGLGLLGVFWKTRRSVAYCQAYPGTKPGSVTFTLLLPHLIRLSTLQGHTPEASFRNALSFFQVKMDEALSREWFYVHQATPATLCHWFTPEHWKELRFALLESLEKGLALDAPLQALGELWFRTWKSAIDERLKLLPYQLVLPVMLCLLASFALMISSLLPQSGMTS